MRVRVTSLLPVGGSACCFSCSDDLCSLPLFASPSMEGPTIQVQLLALNSMEILVISKIRVCSALEYVENRLVRQSVGSNGFNTCLQLVLCRDWCTRQVCIYIHCGVTWLIVSLS